MGNSLFLLERVTGAFESIASIPIQISSLKIGLSGVKLKCQQNQRNTVFQHLSSEHPIFTKKSTFSEKSKTHCKDPTKMICFEIMFQNHLATQQAKISKNTVFRRLFPRFLTICEYFRDFCLPPSKVVWKHGPKPYHFCVVLTLCFWFWRKVHFFTENIMFAIQVSKRTISLILLTL